MRFGFKLWGWRDQLIVWLLLIAIFAVVGVAIRTFLDYRSAAIDLLIIRDQKVTYLSAARLHDELAKFVDSLTALARDARISGGNPTAAGQALRSSQPVQEGLFDGGIALLDNFGHVIASEPDSKGIVGQDWSNREFFRRMLSSNTLYFSDLIEDPQDKSNMIIVSVPLVGEGGQFVGALAGMLRLGESAISPLYATIVRLRVGQSGSNTYLLDGADSILFDSASGRVGDHYDNPALAQALSSNQPGALRTSNSQKHQVIASYAPVPGTAWTLVVEDDWDVVTAQTQRYLQLLIFLLALGVFLLAAGAFLLISRLRRRDAGEEMGDAPAQAAHQLKEMLLPNVMPVLPGWNLAAHYQPQAAIDGNFYDFMLLRDGRLMIAMGEINEDGLPVTVTMATARTTLRAAARSLLSPAAALERINEFLCPELPKEIQVECVLALLDPSSGKLQVANAGYLHPLYRKGNGIEELSMNGSALGVQLGATYQNSNLILERGEWLLFYNDELCQLHNRKGEPFAPTRLHEVLNQEFESGDKVIQGILDAIANFTGEAAARANNVALVVVERLDAHAAH